jgi:hypothetical protein
VESAGLLEHRRGDKRGPCCGGAVNDVDLRSRATPPVAGQVRSGDGRRAPLVPGSRRDPGRSA